MIINFPGFFLVRSQLGWIPFDCAEYLVVSQIQKKYRMGFAFEGKTNASEFHCLFGILHLKKLSLRVPGDAVRVVNSFGHFLFLYHQIADSVQNN